MLINSKNLEQKNMQDLYGAKAKNKILHELFMRAEISWALSDISKSIGPMIDLIFISQFIGINGVTVMSYIAPLIILLGLIGTSISNGARIKTAPLFGAGDFLKPIEFFRMLLFWEELYRFQQLF